MSAPPALPYRNRAVITLTGSPGNADIRGVGNKMIGVTGTLDLHGEGRAGWTQLSASAAAGATSIDLKKAMGWRAGDRIVLASSDFDPGQAEEAVISAVNGSNLTLEQPIRNAHFGQLLTVAGQSVDERAEVGLLTRNITIQGDTGSTPGYGGHIIVLQGATARVEGVELFQMGQRGHLARYPMHWHVAGDVSGQYFRNSSVWRTFSRCVTVHGTDNALVQNNVCYDHTGHGYFLEDGAETGNTFEGNLGLVSRIPQGTDRLLESDSRAATFWITNPDNTYRNNVAAGSKGMGFWCAFPAAPDRALDRDNPTCPRPLRSVNSAGNVAHSNNQGALHVDDGPLPDGHHDGHQLHAAGGSCRSIFGPGGGAFHQLPRLQTAAPGRVAARAESRTGRLPAGRQRDRSNVRGLRNLREEHGLHRGARAPHPDCRPAVCSRDTSSMTGG